MIDYNLSILPPWPIPTPPFSQTQASTLPQHQTPSPHLLLYCYRYYHPPPHSHCLHHLLSLLSLLPLLPCAQALPYIDSIATKLFNVSSIVPADSPRSMAPSLPSRSLAVAHHDSATTTSSCTLFSLLPWFSTPRLPFLRWSHRLPSSLMSPRASIVDCLLPRLPCIHLGCRHHRHPLLYQGCLHPFHHYPPDLDLQGCRQALKVLHACLKLAFKIYTKDMGLGLGLAWRVEKGKESRSW